MRIARVIAIVAVVLMVAGLVLGCGNKHYSLTIAVNGQGGTTAPAPGTYKYKYGESVTITATPDSDWKFDSWSGDASGTNATTTVTMNANKSVTANFSLASTTIIDSSITIESGGTYYLDLAPGYYDVSITSDDGVTVEWLGGGVDQGYNSNGAVTEYIKRSVPVFQSVTFKIYNPTGIFFNPTALLHLRIVKG
jgi:hypothetical protein